MERLKVMTIFGTRPEAIKMAPVVLELQKHPEQIQSLVAVTAQHREMLDQVLHLFQINPDYDLDIMSPSQTLFDITSRALNGLNEVLAEARPDLVLVHGDTTTAMATAMTAKTATMMRKAAPAERSRKSRRRRSPEPPMVRPCRRG